MFFRKYPIISFSKFRCATICWLFI